MATPYNNPYEEFLSLYITADDPASGLVIKLPADVQADPQTGRLSAVVQEAPQLPFEHFKINLKSGAGAPLRTPAVCGTYTSKSVLTPWSAPESGSPATPEDSYSITQGRANGNPCAASEASLPNVPGLDAGTISPVAGEFSPLAVNLRRNDGTQQFPR